MTPEALERLLAPVFGAVSGRTLDAALERDLNAQFPASGATFRDVFAACREAIADGWMCSREAGGIRYGRVIKASEATDGLSVDVVEMENVTGPHHRHPNGEIDVIMPLTKDARFDGRGAGWLVYGPGSAHAPRVTDGKAVILYLLPQGAIEFDKA